MTDLEPQKIITHSLVHQQGMDPRFCGFCHVFFFYFPKSDSGFFVLFRSHSVCFCFSLQGSGFLLFRDTCSDFLQRFITSRCFRQDVPFFCSTSNTYHVELETKSIGSLFGKLEDDLFYSRSSKQSHFFFLSLGPVVWSGKAFKNLLLFLACAEGDLIEIGIINSAVTLRHKFLIIVEQRAGVNTQRKSLKASLNFHGRCIYV